MIEDSQILQQNLEYWYNLNRSQVATDFPFFLLVGVRQLCQLHFVQNCPTLHVEMYYVSQMFL